ncbi:MAG: choice-of-anchor E domain-containing protein, partial [Bacteroidetes bacterium]|nr:choice-of-anchor E domain-containing protein [Bacteroidota bacterium]
MKNLRMLCVRAIAVVAFLAFAVAPRTGMAQCTPAYYKTIVFDSTVTGTGNTSTTFTYPKFNPMLGTLISVKIQAVVSLGYNFTLENQELVPKTFGVKVGRQDDFSSDALYDPLEHITTKSVGSYPLSAWDLVFGSGPDFISKQTNVLHNYLVSDSISGAVAPFMGAGTVSVTHTPSTYTFVQGGASFIMSGAAFDTTHFILTYTYCDAWMLPSGITVFSVRKEAGQSIQLNWQTVNEENGRYYDIEKSKDGKYFTKAGTVASYMNQYNQGVYAFKYNIAPDDGE